MNTNNNANNKQIMYPSLEGFSWPERPFKEDFILTGDRKIPIYYSYEGRDWSIKLDKCGAYNLYMNDEKYNEKPIYLTQGVYRINYLAFKQGCEMEFDRNWKPLSVTYYTKNMNRETFNSKFIIEY